MMRIRATGKREKPIKARWKRLNQVVIALAVISVPALLLASLLKPPAMPDLSYAEQEHREFLLKKWARGESIVVLRHLERCDRADVPCLFEEDGITARSALVATELSDDFYQLGLDKTDIYNSPLARTDQTADLLFSDRSSDQAWLYDCRKEDTLLRDALANKQQGRNLVLVTHSSCIARFEDDLGFSSDTPEYGAAIFLSVEPQAEQVRLLGFVDADDWDQVFNFSKP